jgi:hypothetical protein
MTADVLHKIDKGLLRLLKGPRDIEGGTPVPATSPSAADGHPELRRLFEHYREGYQYLRPHCLRWWRGLIASAHEDGMSREEAVRAAYDSHPAGPASAPEFVWLVRHHWLLCDEINRGLALEQRAAPQDVLLQWLIDVGDDDAVELATAMTYWPIGLDAQGQWC